MQPIPDQCGFFCKLLLNGASDMTVRLVAFNFFERGAKNINSPFDKKKRLFIGCIIRLVINEIDERFVEEFFFMKSCFSKFEGSHIREMF